MLGMHHPNKTVAGKGAKKRVPPKFIRAKKTGVIYHRRGDTDEYFSDDGDLLDTLIYIAIMSGQSSPDYEPDPDFRGAGGTGGGAGSSAEWNDPTAERTGSPAAVESAPAQVASEPSPASEPAPTPVESAPVVESAPAAESEPSTDTSSTSTDTGSVSDAGGADSSQE